MHRIIAIALVLIVCAQSSAAQELPRRGGRPLEQIPDVIVTYESVRSPHGYRVRTVVTRPRSAIGERIPAILFIPWLSCDPVERAEPGNDGFAHMLRDVARGSGMLMLRVEKPGNGDSEGPPCAEGRLDHEIAAYRAALAALRSRKDVDTNRIVIMGGSLGGGIAPILAAESSSGLIGVVSVGGFTRTWYEHMLEIERARLTLSGRPPAQVNADLRRLAEFYIDYLHGKRTPVEVLSAKPHLRDVWPSEGERQYGRHARFYHAVAELNVEDAWAKLAALDIPALVVWGDYDWIMSRAEQERAVAILNANGRGLGTLAILQGVDHGLMSYASMLDAFNDRNPVYRREPGRVVNEWLRGVVQRHALRTRESAVRRELEALYEENAAAFMRGDITGVLRLRAPDFHAVTPDGVRHDFAEMARVAEGVMNAVRKWNALTFTIDSLAVSGDTAYAIVTQHTDRMALRQDNQVHHLQTWVTQRETWVRAGRNWLIWRVDQLRNQRRLIDGNPG